MKPAARMCKYIEDMEWNKFSKWLEEALIKNNGIYFLNDRWWYPYYQEERQTYGYPLVTKYYDKLTSLGYKIEKCMGTIDCKLTKTRFHLPFGSKPMLINRYKISACCKEEV